MAELVSRTWEVATPFRICDSCKTKCTSGDICVCYSCPRVFHKQCYTSKDSVSALLDCDCSHTILISDGRLHKCAISGCNNIPNSNDANYWTCTRCYTHLETVVLKSLLNHRDSEMEFDFFMNMFLRSVHSPVDVIKIDQNNVRRLSLKACVGTICIKTPLAKIWKNVHKVSKISHIYNVLLHEMKESNNVYDFPLKATDFRGLNEIRESQPTEVIETVLKKFKLYLRDMSSGTNTKVIFIGSKQVKYMTTHQFNNATSLLNRVKARAYLGLKKDIIIAEYKDALFDLYMLEKANKIWLSGDREMVYCQSCLTPKIDGLYQKWLQLVPDQTKTLPTK